MRCDDNGVFDFCCFGLIASLCPFPSTKSPTKSRTCRTSPKSTLHIRTSSRSTTTTTTIPHPLIPHSLIPSPSFPHAKKKQTNVMQAPAYAHTSPCMHASCTVDCYTRTPFFLVCFSRVLLAYMYVQRRGDRLYVMYCTPQFAAQIGHGYGDAGRRITVSAEVMG